MFIYICANIYIQMRMNVNKHVYTCLFPNSDPAPVSTLRAKHYHSNKHSNSNTIDSNRNSDDSNSNSNSNKNIVQNLTNPVASLYMMDHGSSVRGTMLRAVSASETLRVRTGNSGLFSPKMASIMLFVPRARVVDNCKGQGEDKIMKVSWRRQTHIPCRVTHLVDGPWRPT
jgi:hypothetical protein